jgi:hypothetical protein
MEVDFYDFDHDTFVFDDLQDNIQDNEEKGKIHFSAALRTFDYCNEEFQSYYRFYENEYNQIVEFNIQYNKFLSNKHVFKRMVKDTILIKDDSFIYYLRNKYRRQLYADNDIAARQYYDDLGAVNYYNSSSKTIINSNPFINCPHLMITLFAPPEYIMKERYIQSWKNFKGKLLELNKVRKQYKRLCISKFNKKIRNEQTKKEYGKSMQSKISEHMRTAVVSNEPTSKLVSDSTLLSSDQNLSDQNLLSNQITMINNEESSENNCEVLPYPVGVLETKSIKLGFDFALSSTKFSFLLALTNNNTIVNPYSTLIKSLEISSNLMVINQLYNFMDEDSYFEDEQFCKTINIDYDPYI